MTTSQAIATVVTIAGQAFARDTEGNLRILKADDILHEGEIIITSSGGRVELTTLEGELLAVGERQSIALTADLSEETRAQATDAALADGTVEQILQALDSGTSLDDILEAPAAGLAGGPGGDGNNFVRLLRISEGVDPLAFEFDPATIVNVEEFLNGFAEEGDGTGSSSSGPQTTPDVTLSFDISDAGTGTIVGTVQNATGVTVTITGSDGSNYGPFPATLHPDGTWSVDLSGQHFDEEVTYTATATARDAAGRTDVATDSSSYDLLPTVDVSFDISDTGVGTLTGTSDNATSVSVTISGSDGSSYGPFPATLNPDGSWSVDLSSVTFPEEVTFTATATATDNAANSATASDTASYDLNAPPVAIDDPAGQPYSVSLGSMGSGWSNPDSNHSVTDVSALKADGTAGTLYQTDNMLGVQGSPRAGSAANFEPTQLESNGSGESEAIVLTFSGNLDSASFSFSNMFKNDNDTNYIETGRWVAYFDGVEVARGEFSCADNSGIGTCDIDTGGLLFNSVRFEAVHNGDPLDSSGYFLTGFEGSGPAEGNDAYLISDGDSLTISAQDGLLANDSDPDNDSLMVTEINGAQFTSGDTITLDSGAALTIYGDGHFSYNTNGSFSHLDPGEYATDTFEYTISDGMGGEDTATVTVTVVGTPAVYEGTNGDDMLSGSDAGDVLIGGGGNDTLTGGLGADVFVWRLNDQGNSSQPAIDTVTDFNLAQGDVLDLRDLLDGYSGSLDRYLKVEELSGDTVLSISTIGDIDASRDQVVMLDGVTGLIEASLTSQQDIIQNLINKHAILVD